MSKTANSPDRGGHVVLYGLFGFGNTGNDASLKVMLDHLRRLKPDARITVVATQPDAVSGAHGVPAVAIHPTSLTASLPTSAAGRLVSEARRWGQARALLQSADCLIVPGTGILDDFGCTVMQHPYQLWKWCTAARQVGAGVKFVSIGAGPVEQPWSRRFFRWSARAATHRSYRDEASRSFARDVLGLNIEHDVVTPDLVFGLDPPVTERHAGPVQTVGVGVMDYHTWRGDKNSLGDGYETYMSKLTEFCHWLLRRNLHLHLLLGEPGDQATAADLHARLVRRETGFAKSLSIADIRTIDDLCREIGKTDAVVATRFHNIVSAMLCARPAVSIGYAHKNRAVMHDFGLGEYCQNIWDFDVTTLCKHFDAVTADPQSVARRMQDVALRFKTTVNAHLADVIGGIGALSPPHSRPEPR